MSLTLYQRLTRSTTGLAYLGDLTALARDWRRSSRAVGGYWQGSFRISQEDVTRAELVDFYNMWPGCRLVETAFGMTSWEGYIEEARLVQGGVEQVQSLKPDLFHNRVKVIYSSDIGERTEIAWSENTDSSDEFGECGLILTLGGATAAGATALRDRHLIEYAWPRSRRSGGDATEGGAPSTSPDVLTVRLAGYWHTLNWRYRESSETAAASTLIGTLVGESEFVTAQRIETNSDSVYIGATPIPRRLGDLIAEIVEQGDSSGNVWKCGVYGGRGLVYEQSPTAWTYQMRGGALLDKAGGEVELAQVEPGFLLYNPEAPTGWPRAGTASDWDDPQIAYVDEVELVSGYPDDKLRLRYSDSRESVEVVAERLNRGNL